MLWTMSSDKEVGQLDCLVLYRLLKDLDFLVHMTHYIAEGI